MASIIRKKKRNKFYYYAVESRRVDGKPRIVWQKYLGTLDSIVQKVTEPNTPATAKVFSFGAVAALYRIAQRARIVEIVDSHVPKRAQGLSVGEYMLLAAINRATEPTSKRRLAEWYEDTVLRRLIPARPTLLSSQRFWSNMQYLDAATITEIEEDLSRHLVQEFDLSLSALVYDTTNFITYLDTANPCELAQRGHSKQKRQDLRIVGLALMVTSDFFVPLFHETYPGNLTDSQEFTAVTDALVERYRAVSREFEHVTLVFDKGNVTHENMSTIGGGPFHFVSSLVPSHHKELLEVPLEEFESLSGRFIGEQAYRTSKRVLGRDCTVVVTYSESLKLGQMQGMITYLRKATSALKNLQSKLERRRSGEVTRGRAPTPESLRKTVKGILNPRQRLHEVIKVRIIEDEPVPRLTYEVDHAALTSICERHYGKTLLCTDNYEWTNEEIVAAYREQAGIETSFKQMKDPFFVAWHPMYHWTDQSIRVHAFYCVLALTLTSLLRKTAYEKEIQMSVPELLKTLSGVEEVAHIYPTGSAVKDHLTLTEMSDDEKSLFDALNLAEFVQA